ncbi:hypothetical protein [Pseudomonas chlororaphis]|uniref:hypothetical protein n=1 Tax=Pseudomonas chlororaphis TaxID=587753 RepID=UPI00131F4EC8|nr:hypothetical protein [Pseudomonas chlororaphis]QHC93036.1 hypothetical protein PchlR47_24925 [Pseudomonas chlororaphis]
MVSLRYDAKATSENLWTICELIRDRKCDEIILFASEKNNLEEEEYNNNLPLVVALAKYIIPNVDSVFVVFDGVFLTAARYPRYLEVRDLLNVAEASDKVFYSELRAPITIGMTPDNAVATLSELGEIKPLTPNTRADYFSLLSSFTESQLVEIFKF